MKPTCEIVEYASMRLRFVCAIATTLPISIDSTASAISMSCQLRDHRIQPFGEHADREHERRDLRRRADEQRHGRRRAVVDVRHPHVERHGAELEGDADDDERQAEDQAEVARPRLRGRRPPARPAAACRSRRRRSRSRTAACRRRSRRARSTSSPTRRRRRSRGRTRPSRTATATAARRRDTPSAGCRPRPSPSCRAARPGRE